MWNTSPKLDLRSREHIRHWNSDVGRSYAASKLYLTITPRARVEYLVNKTLPAAGVSVDNARG